MQKFIRQLISSAAIIGAAMLPQAHAATVIDFEGADLTGLYFDGESFSQNGFTMTVGYDFGTVDTGSGLGSVAPSGNGSQYYFNSNDGDLLIQRTNGGTFSLDGFSAAFVPLVPTPSPAQTIVIVALATDINGGVFGTYFPLGTSATNSYPFLTYDHPADFGRFTDLVAVDFFACALTSTSVCQVATENSAQFALDNVMLTVAVPEPATTALMALGLLGVILRARRSFR